MNMKNFEFDFMAMILVMAAILILVSFWKAHRTPGFQFNAFDLIMTDGKVDKISVAFMLVLGVTTWILIDLHIVGKLTEGYFTTYGAMWVVPLVAKVVFNKTETPNVQTTNITSLTTSVSSSTDANGYPNASPYPQPGYPAPYPAPPPYNGPYAPQGNTNEPLR